jgi:hypothetical protein
MSETSGTVVPLTAATNGRPIKFTPERLEQIKNLVERGMSREQIAERRLALALAAALVLASPAHAEDPVAKQGAFAGADMVAKEMAFGLMVAEARAMPAGQETKDYVSVSAGILLYDEHCKPLLDRETLVMSARAAVVGRPDEYREAEKRANEYREKVGNSAFCDAMERTIAEVTK